MEGYMLGDLHPIEKNLESPHQGWEGKNLGPVQAGSELCQEKGQASSTQCMKGAQFGALELGQAGDRSRLPECPRPPSENPTQSEHVPLPHVILMPCNCIRQRAMSYCGTAGGRALRETPPCTRRACIFWAPSVP
mmetsp:Transcript_56766/g.101247  ORF Transcript_56766/g.101247 Transcript_56766/m.101247 type:complete len:135 (-) Transcript_56766:2455-2859(-)